MNMWIKWVVIGVLAAVVIMIVAGCSTTGERNERGDLVVTYAVMKLIEQSDDVTSDNVIGTVERVRGAVDGSEIVEASELQELVMAQLDLSGLDPSDRFLVQHVIGEIQAELVGEVDGEPSELLPEDYAVQLEEWLSLIEAAAYMAGES